MLGKNLLQLGLFYGGSFLIEASGYGIKYGVKSCSGGVLGFEAMLVIKKGEVRFDYGVDD